MMQGVIVIDTSILCCWLRVPGKDTAGPDNDKWDHDRVELILREREDRGSFFVLPFATIIETGNHIAQSNGNRFALARALSELIEKASRGDDPWVAFSEQANLLSDKLSIIRNDWPSLAAQKFSLGDYLIKDVAEYYAKTGMRVEILTGDMGLKAFEPANPVMRPRRRR